jgi:hypothetical protein
MPRGGLCRRAGLAQWPLIAYGNEHSFSHGQTLHRPYAAQVSPQVRQVRRITPMKSKTSVRSPRNIETRKKKARRVIPRSKVTRNQGNTAGARKRLKKQAGIRRAQVAA